MSGLSRRAVLAGLSAAALTSGLPASGATRKAFGMTAALSGPAAFLGRSMRAGIELALLGAASRGEPSLDLLALDDGYRTSTAVANMEHMLARPEVIAAVGCVGTPTALEVAPMAASAPDPMVFYGALTGAQALRGPQHPNAFHYRASYGDELRTMVSGFRTAGIEAEDIALLAQSEGDQLDGFGQAVRDALMGALKDLDIVDSSFSGFLDRHTVRVQRNTTDVNAAVDTLYRLRPAPRVLVLASTALPCAKVIRMLRPVLPSVHFASCSFVGTQALIHALGPELAEGVMVTQVVPSLESKGPMTLAFLRDARAHGRQPNLIMYEGYASARLLLSALPGPAQDLDRAAVRAGLDTLATRPEFDATQRQFGHNVWSTVVRCGKPVALDWSAPHARHRCDDEG